jgi:recombination protein RecA
MKEKLESILSELKAIGFPISKIEMELGFSNGLLGKAKNGVTNLSDEKMLLLQNFYKMKTGNSIELEDEPETVLVVSETGLKEKPSVQRNAKVDEVMAKINKDFGPGTIMRLGDAPTQKFDVISTGSLMIDRATGINGLPRGRFVEIYGPESSGKTTITLHVIAEAQKLGLMCAFIDAEHAFDAEYAASLNVNVDELNVSQPDYGEQALEIADRLISTGLFGVVVVDSVAALTPKSEIEGEMGDSKMGLHARLMSQACRKLVGIVAKSNTLLIFVNQIRMKIGGYGNPEVVPGGEALKFYSSIRMDVRKSTQLKDGEVSVGNLTKVKIVKNKCAPPFKTAEFDILYGQGIDRIGELIDLAVEKNVVKKSGSWYSYNDSKLGQGRDAVRELLEANPEMIAEIESKIL